MFCPEFGSLKAAAPSDSYGELSRASSNAEFGSLKASAPSFKLTHCPDEGTVA
jgi:hypothetical protein